MKLNIAERLALSSVVAQIQGSRASQRIYSDLLHELGLTEQEFIDAKVKDKGNGRIQFDSTFVKDVPIGDFAHAAIINVFAKMDKEETLTQDLIGLYDRFIEPPKE
jgi:hypothetical protein